MRVTDHGQLVVWQRGVSLAIETCRVRGRFPREETYGLTAQIRRAAVSIPASVAEGNGRLHQTLAEIAPALGYANDEELAVLRELLDHVGRMLTRLLERLEA